MTHLYRCILPAANAKVKIQKKHYIYKQLPMPRTRYNLKKDTRAFGLVDDQLFNRPLMRKCIMPRIEKLLKTAGYVELFCSHEGDTYSFGALFLI